MQDATKWVEPTIVECRPHQLAWLRRPELDTDTVDVWELPDGRLYAAEKGKEPALRVWK